MKFINLRRPGSKPVFVVLPSENKKYTFYINNVKVSMMGEGGFEGMGGRGVRDKTK